MPTSVRGFSLLALISVAGAECEPVPQDSQLCLASTLRCLSFAQHIFVM